MASALAVALILSGCSSSGTCTRPEEAEDDTYPARTSPENVIEKLNLAYEYKDLDAYLDCLADDVTFYLCPDDVEPGEDPYWGKQVEESIHQSMFDVVDRISLMFTNAKKETLPGPDPGDPVTYKHLENTDLRITEGIMTYFANAPQEFLIQVDPSEEGPRGETLLEIVEWWDLSDWERPGGASSWSRVKSMFRVLNR